MEEKYPRGQHRVRKYRKPPSNFRRFVYWFLRLAFTGSAAVAAYYYSIGLLKAPDLPTELLTRSSLGLTAGLIAFGLSAWLTKPLVNEVKMRWVPWDHRSDYWRAGIFILIGLLIGCFVLFIGASVGAVR